MLVSFEHVTFGYVGVPVVRDVSFAIHEKERVGFLGGNGEGKTTILKLLTGELTPRRRQHHPKERALARVSRTERRIHLGGNRLRRHGGAL